MAVKEYLTIEKQSPESMFDYLYQDWPEVMNEQLDLLADKVSRDKH